MAFLNPFQGELQHHSQTTLRANEENRSGSTIQSGDRHGDIHELTDLIGQRI
jgi:hypothetical protein